MEIIFGVLSSACLAYMITEINVVQSDVKEIFCEIANLKSLLVRARDSDRRK